MPAKPLFALASAFRAACSQYSWPTKVRASIPMRRATAGGSIRCDAAPTNWAAVVRSIAGLAPERGSNRMSTSNTTARMRFSIIHISRGFPGKLSCLSRLLLLLCLLSELAEAQTSVRTIYPSEYNIQRWTTREGLPSDHVRSVYQSHDGYIWLSTEVGVVRFNGREFDVFDADDIPGWNSSYAYRISQTRDHTMWVYNHTGDLTAFDGEQFREVWQIDNERVISMRFATVDSTLLIQTDQNIYIASSLNDIRRSVFSVPEGTLARAWIKGSDGQEWLAAQNGLYHYDGHSVVLYDKNSGLPSSFVARAARLKNGKLWVSTGEGAGFWDKGQFDLVIREDSVNASFGVQEVFEDWEGRMWIFANRKLYLCDEDECIPVEIEGEEQPRFLEVFQTTTGLLLTFSGYPAGNLYALDQNGWRLFDLHPDVKVAGNMFEDREGNLWFGSNAGLFTLTPRKMLAYTTAEGLPEDEVFPLLEDKNGRVWIGTWGGGLARLDGQRLSVFTVQDGLGSDFIRSLSLRRDGGIVAAMIGMYAVYKGGRQESFEHRSFEERFIYTVFDTESEGLLIRGRKTDSSILLSNHAFSGLQMPFNAASRIVFWHTAEDATGEIYFATHHGLFKGKRDHWKQWTTQDGLSINLLTHLYFGTKGDLWISTYGGGLNRMRGDSIFVYDRSMGLHSNTVNAAVEDDQGYMWLTHNNGVSRVLRSDLDAVMRGELAAFGSEVFTEADGLPSSDISRAQPSMIKTRDGRIWVPTTRGVAVFDPANIPRNAAPPPILIDNIEVNGIPISESENLSLTSEQRNVTLQFSSLSYTSPTKNRYSYYLEGYDRDWSPPGRENIARYTNLPAGDYTFSVKGSNNDGVWSEQPAEFSFTIAPYWYFRWYSLLGFAGLLAGIVVLWNSRQQYRKRLEIEQTRTRIADDLHDDIGSKLTAVSQSLEFMSNKPRLDETDRKELARQVEVSSRLVQDLRDVVWAIDSGKDQLPALVDRMRHFVALIARELQVEWNIPNDLPERKLNMEWRRAVYFLFKEAVTNTIRHSGASTVFIEVKVFGSMFHLTVRDDGIGFSEASLQSGRGVRTMNRRAEKVGGWLKIDSAPGRGVEIRLDVNMP